MGDPVTLLTSAIAGLILAMVTTPVGVSGAVFLLPVQLTILGVPNPAVTPTNLLFNIVATPGALLRYRRGTTPGSPFRANPLTKVLVVGTVPGVVFGSLVRVFLIPGPRLFRLVVAAILLPLGLWLCGKALIRSPAKRDPVVPSSLAIGALALGVGVVGGIYGIGGGSLLSPILVGRGLPTRLVAPAALTTTFVTSLAGAVAYSLIALASPGQHIAPVWAVGLLAGLGGLIGGYLGARLQPKAPETVLRTLLGSLAVASALLYIWQALRM
ncbi:anion permease [Mycobacterium intermedium]|uniref:Probable membrane transporter protein n=1 Tax=Mycobacterium intermedium TaxID=28445 RepID=A0A1E3SC86_MYCIE|nr:sulfite exporter TauE/SafE family protein [Mycobacterium intermedium]MCV6962506.1 sulfite exporter TauE/SafE family protein [Mycobacterium intermedium]ODQ99776.1 hypothetical protein BHQ20_15895 [Mycobacterium intermedium]OPE48512.1 anion permease [Mycobacterium intermedium]ORA93806.1 anion permease [Mycobacterium intermedium]